jgi:hypothetical protein
MSIHVSITVNDKPEELHHVTISNVSAIGTSQNLTNSYRFECQSLDGSSNTGMVSHVPDSGVMVLASKVIQNIAHKGVGR